MATPSTLLALLRTTATIWSSASVTEDAKRLLELGRTEQAVDFITRSGHGGSLVSGSIAPGIRDPDAASLLMTKSTIAAEKK